MNYEEEFRRNAFKPIKENPIILDFTGCKYLGEIHLIIKNKIWITRILWRELGCLMGLFEILMVGWRVRQS